MDVLKARRKASVRKQERQTTSMMGKLSHFDSTLTAMKVATGTVSYEKQRAVENMVKKNKVEEIKKAEEEKVTSAKKKRNPDADGMSGVVPCALYAYVRAPRMCSSPTYIAPSISPRGQFNSQRCYNLVLSKLSSPLASWVQLDISSGILSPCESFNQCGFFSEIFLTCIEP